MNDHLQTSQKLMDQLDQCMHCGFCLPSCPTYRQVGLETYNPRGRIALIKGVATEKLKLNAEFTKHIDACLGCRACETACPANVAYGNLLESAREFIVQSDQKSNWIQRFILKHLFTHPHRLYTLGNLLWFVQKTGLQKLAKSFRLLNLLPSSLREMQEIIDPVVSPFIRRKRKNLSPSSSHQRLLSVGLFTGCIMDIFFYQTNQATARLLTSLGCNVVFIKRQGCCGALHLHAGYKSEAMQLAKRNIQAFEQSKVDLLVNNAGGCGLALKEYHHLFENDQAWYQRAVHFVEHVRDIHEVLYELSPLPFKKSLNIRATYQDSCHLAHGQHIRKSPRQLLQQIPGLEYIELEDADQCCGSAGIYNLTHFPMSMKILDEKMAYVHATNAQLIVTSNPGCLLQMKKGIIRSGLDKQMQAIHLVDLLDQLIFDGDNEIVDRI
ncbi:glycolate oxidase iron-sulfur subunit [Seinonella peptonophila]|uniref:Glycolate oxidase iron-sulfur subunit n=1 Tax=Seinonella peptonophila TaxID=112248 RepID=A0A1M4SRU9_9BACL|nr:(Fe-S)-binding protein [Seinonella peptonophila]SHE34891.1 glycolate oxidase iron-sulfur subunit [Seinonella peptonophila]